jgi:dihydroorotate dehydrogenase
MALSLYRAFRPLLFALEPESAHRLTLRLLAAGLVPTAPVFDSALLATRLWGRSFANPLGLAAGFDKDGEAVPALFRLGFGFVEVGSVTPQPQAGNPTPRLFRLQEDRAIVNSFGFNSTGMEAVGHRLAAWRARARPGPLGINLGKNKTSADAAGDYAAVAQRLAPLADYLVLNLSSPNTPGLRELQAVESLTAILRAVRAVLPQPAPPLLVKLDPDLSDEAVQGLCTLAQAERLDGLVLTNTTLRRPPGLSSPLRARPGGLSGQPLFAPSTERLRQAYRLTQGRVPLIGVGGIGSGREAYLKIRAGASLLQLYSALVYEGPGLVGVILRDLERLLRRDGFTQVAQAIGKDA